jgi:8-oxo-dGTP diphosphatase
MAARDGDGWIECSCGGKHWGLYGAAGLLLIRGSSVLLQHRAPWVHNGDTWGIPGGARDSHENFLEAALREAHEEVGITASEVDVLLESAEDHGGWSYHTIIAMAHDKCEPIAANQESIEVRWVERESVSALALHPAFEKNWPKLLELIHTLP